MSINEIQGGFLEIKKERGGGGEVIGKEMKIKKTLFYDKLNKSQWHGQNIYWCCYLYN